MLLIILFILNVVKTMEITQYINACATCIRASPRFSYSCYRCYDDGYLEFCKETIRNVVECPRGNSKYNMCRD